MEVPFYPLIIFFFSEAPQVPPSSGPQEAGGQVAKQVQSWGAGKER